MADGNLVQIEEKVDRLIRGVAKVLETVNSKSGVVYRPASTDFYQPKGGQLQFAIGSPTWKAPEDKNGTKVSYMDKAGAVFIEGAPPDPTREGKLDWANKKIVFALSDKDIAAIVYALEKGVVDKGGYLVNLTHVSGPANAEITKAFKIKPGQPNNAGVMTYQLELSDISAKNRVSLFVSPPDLMRLKLLLTQAMSRILGWDVA